LETLLNALKAVIKATARSRRIVPAHWISDESSSTFVFDVQAEREKIKPPPFPLDIPPYD